ncbi:conserved hypothetical protein [Culex quinquefasciatus]|uniref:Uncharacterized protein n=1 Tax=Culex quinquefasciatus TaxID=7176 RepID=B0XCJ7_CULQU|nr:conserved hypothetical protein [Culex quinquefasciatus]|eukprot:XP_001867369.1 conserved hypothetical protein [Culex quinquefasciatus]
MRVESVLATLLNQMYQTCVHEGQLGFPCEDSPMFFPEGEQQQPGGATPDVEEPAPPKAAMPSQELLPPMESAADGAASQNEDEDEAEKVGLLNMPVLSDNFVHNYDHQQMHDDTFDPVEEIDNTAQEVIDGQIAEVQASEVAAEEQDNTQEVEISEDDNKTVEDNEEQSTVQDAAVESNDVEESEPEVVLLEDNHVDVQSGLQNDEQTVEESEPVVLDVQQDEQPTVAVEIEAPQDEQTQEDDSINKVQSDKEEQTPEKVDDATAVQIEEANPEVTNEIESHDATPVLDNEVVSEIELSDASHESTDQRVSEPLVLAETADDEQTEVTQDQPSEPAEEPVASGAALAVEGSSARTADLPEFIVSTVADLRKGVPAPPLRRRKTFLFKADART